MKVSELITELQKLPPDTVVVTYDGEWDDYDRVRGVKLRHSITLISEPRTFFQTPKGKPIKSPDLKTLDVVEIVSMPARLEELQ